MTDRLEPAVPVGAPLAGAIGPRHLDERLIAPASGAPTDSLPETESRALGVILVHGYLGAPEDLALLTAALADRHGQQRVETVRLPGHERGAATPAFDEAAFLAEIAAAIDRQIAQGRAFVLVGHSTGGSLLLAEIARRLEADAGSLRGLRLLVLAATPPRIDLGYAARWQAHAAGLEHSLHDIAALVSLVNRLARRVPLAVPCPVLVVHGEADELVPVADADLWDSRRLAAPHRQVRIARAAHRLFAGAGAAQTLDVVARAIDDAAHRESAAPLHPLVPALANFCAAWPDSARHLRHSPAAQRALSEPVDLGPLSSVEPTLANIEITTRCNLGCSACARTERKTPSRHMALEDFRRVLQHLPHAFRIVLVGLGEPLLHPQLLDCIRIAVAQGRRVGLVTNATLLDADMARALCASGLASITFSLDTVDQATADRLRQGCDLTAVTANIAAFMAERQRLGGRPGTSVFTALRRETVGQLADIIDFVADRGIDALMVSDLNFAGNQPDSLQQNLAAEPAKLLRHALKHAVARRLPVLSVRGLEELALETRYLDHLLLRGETLAERSPRHTHCCSPWQCVPVNVEGQVTVCDCQPEAIVGSLIDQPLSAWWNGTLMTGHRQRMLSDAPPAACRFCPRF